jgi:RNase P/RNase MRP subunit p30
MIDFVMPNGNEEEFVPMAERLGYTSLCFVYTTDFKRKDIKASYALLCEKNFDKAKQKADIVIARCEDARKAIESKRIDFIYDIEYNLKRDSMHFRNSGLNHVLCTLMKENNVGYIINIKDIINPKDTQFIGRVIQNIRLCKKFGVKVELGSFAATPFEMKGANDVKSLMKEFGIN